MQTVSLLISFQRKVLAHVNGPTLETGKPKFCHLPFRPDFGLLERISFSALKDILTGLLTLWEFTELLLYFGGLAKEYGIRRAKGRRTVRLR